ncbi:MAG: PEP-CTERM sorting domain-containing protein [Limisphaerales bacterium]
MFDAADQTITKTTFDDGAWNNGVPELNVGESAFFYLEPAPEPSVACLGAVGLLALAWRRRRSKNGIACDKALHSGGQ